jgi:hypothetical protein
MLSKNIIKVEYTISLKGGSSSTSGYYDTSSGSIFTFTGDMTPRLKIDTSANTPPFTFKSGNTYIINTKYYYMKNGVETALRDQETNKETYTTILNL